VVTVSDSKVITTSSDTKSVIENEFDEKKHQTTLTKISQDTIVACWH